MDHLRRYNSVLLVQAGLDTPPARRQLEQLQRRSDSAEAPILAFFHSAAAALDASDQLSVWAGLTDSLDIHLAVCQSARARRVDSPPPVPWIASTLVRFWSAVLTARNLGAPEWAPVRSGGVLVRLGSALDALEWRERLELVLAAASLDLDVIVAFEGDALVALAGEDLRGWGQLRDHGLARMVTTGSDTAGDKLERVAQDTLESWASERTVLWT
jgi:hypothetical protein